MNDMYNSQSHNYKTDIKGKKDCNDLFFTQDSNRNEYCCNIYLYNFFAMFVKAEFSFKNLMFFAMCK